MRPTSIFIIAAIATVVSARKNALKTKKYKCIEVMEDDDALVSRNFNGWSKADEELRPIGSARLGPPPPVPTFAPPTMAPVQAIPQQYETTRRRMMEEYTTTPSSFISPMAAPRDKNGNPLVLSPQHCNQVKHYAGMYGVSDVLTWVKSNCAFAKMYLPTASCAEINILIGSCYSAGGAPAPASAPAPQQPAPTPRPRYRTTAAPPPPPAAAPAPAAGLASLLRGNWKPWFW